MLIVLMIMTVREGRLAAVKKEDFSGVIWQN
jgi:hypothetical protein